MNYISQSHILNLPTVLLGEGGVRNIILSQRGKWTQGKLNVLGQGHITKQW